MGADISMNHGAFVFLLDGKLKDYQYVTDRQKVAKKAKAHGTYLPHSRVKDMHERSLRRLEFWGGYLYDLLEAMPAYVGVEDYAYRVSQHAHQIGEVGCLLRLQSWYHGAKIRFHDPSTVKLFAAYDGSADKTEMAFQVQQRWPETQEFARYVDGKYRYVAEDLCDAYAVAQLVWREVQLRRGEIILKSLHAKEIQVFNRVTQRWPSNILDREWVQREND